MTGDSDVDFLVEFDRPVGAFDSVDLQDDLARRLGRPGRPGDAGSDQGTDAAAHRARGHRCDSAPMPVGAAVEAAIRGPWVARAPADEEVAWVRREGRQAGVRYHRTPEQWYCGCSAQPWAPGSAGGA
jgi:hypothetical protein